MAEPNFLDSHMVPLVAMQPAALHKLSFLTWEMFVLGAQFDTVAE